MSFIFIKEIDTPTQAPADVLLFSIVCLNFKMMCSLLLYFSNLQMLLTALLVCLFSSGSMGADDAALITNLPNLMGTPSYRQFSGYLRASPTHRLFYWFVESQGSPSADPVIVWFNGGPGYSSMEGMLIEHGPFLVQPNTSLVRNPYAWNRLANVLYIESPAGVGFSYSTDNETTTNDTKVRRLFFVL